VSVVITEPTMHINILDDVAIPCLWSCESSPYVLCQVWCVYICYCIFSIPSMLLQLFDCSVKRFTGCVHKLHLRALDRSRPILQVLDHSQTTSELQTPCSQTQRKTLRSIAAKTAISVPRHLFTFYLRQIRLG